MEELQAKESSSSSSSELHFAWKILDFLTGPAGAVFVALLAVGFHYYQNAIRNVGIVSWIRRDVVGLIRNGFDGIISFFYEWSSSSSSSGAGVAAGGTRGIPALLVPEEEDQGTKKETPTKSSGYKRSNLKHMAGKKRGTRFGQNSKNGSAQSSTSTRKELEPAFLSPELYPKGWLVYHPPYGLIEKEELDQILLGNSIPQSRPEIPQVHQGGINRIKTKDDDSSDRSSEEKKDETDDGGPKWGQHEKRSTSDDNTQGFSGTSKTKNSAVASDSSLPLSERPSADEHETSTTPKYHPVQQSERSQETTKMSGDNRNDMRIIPSSVAAGG